MPEFAVGGRAAQRHRAVAGLRRLALLFGVALLAWTPSDGARAGSPTHKARPRTLRRDAAERLDGVAFDDRNANGVHDDREPGVPGAWIAVVADSSATPIASAFSGPDGAYSLPRPPGVWTLQCVPAPGYRPEGSSLRSAATGSLDFGLTAFRHLSLTCANVVCLGTVDLGEHDPARLESDQTLADDDLVVGTDTGDLDRLLVWFARHDGNPFLCGGRDYAREAPAAVLSLAVLGVERDGGGRPEVVIGTRNTPAGNFFTWFPQSFQSNEGYFPARHSQACRTLDRGDVQAIATGSTAARPGFDLFVGTRSPGGGGTVELWRTDPAVPTTCSLAAHYPEPAGGGTLGAVTSLAVSPLGASGEDLVVGTESGGHGGLVVLGESGGAPLAPRWHRDDLGTAVRCVVAADLTGDSRPDLVVGIQETASSGRLELWRNDSFGDELEFTLVRTLPTSGVPWSLVATDLGGLPGPDVAVGFRATADRFDGRVEIYYCDAGTLPLRGSDPAAGRLSGWVPALGTGRFRSPSPRHPGVLPRDLIAGVRSGPRQGSVQVFVR